MIPHFTFSCFSLTLIIHSTNPLALCVSAFFLFVIQISFFFFLSLWRWRKKKFWCLKFCSELCSSTPNPGSDLDIISNPFGVPIEEDQTLHLILNPNLNPILIPTFQFWISRGRGIMGFYQIFLLMLYPIWMWVLILMKIQSSTRSSCSVLYSSKFQCLYSKVFVQVLCFTFVCVWMFFSISLNIDGFCKIMKFVSDVFWKKIVSNGFCKIINFVCDEMWTEKLWFGYMLWVIVWICVWIWVFWVFWRWIAGLCMYSY